MVHRKSNYALNYKKISTHELRSLYEENAANRQLYGIAHKIHQPLPYEDEPCDCDETCSKDKGVQSIKRYRSVSENNFTSLANGPIQSSACGLRVSSILPQHPSSTKAVSSSTKFAKSKSHSDICKTNDSLLIKCHFCGKDYSTMKHNYIIGRNSKQDEIPFCETKSKNPPPHSTPLLSEKHHGRSSASKTLPKEDVTRRDFKTVETISNRNYNQSEVGSSYMTKTKQKNTSKCGAVTLMSNSAAEDVLFSKVSTENGFRGVLKCHPVLREFDLLPAMQRFVNGSTKKRLAEWNARGDRTAEPSRCGRTSSAELIRNRRATSEDNIFRAAREGASRSHNTSRPTPHISRCPLNSRVYAGTISSHPVRVPRSTSAHRNSDPCGCRWCRDLFWSRE